MRVAEDDDVRVAEDDKVWVSEAYRVLCTTMRGVGDKPKHVILGLDPRIHSLMLTR